MRDNCKDLRKYYRKRDGAQVIYRVVTPSENGSRDKEEILAYKWAGGNLWWQWHQYSEPEKIPPTQKSRGGYVSGCYEPLKLTKDYLCKRSALFDGLESNGEREN